MSSAVEGAAVGGPTGRVDQRVRTWHAIVMAGRRLYEAGHTPTVAQAADEAMVSRATAYRYFGSQEELLHACVIVEGWPTSQEIFTGADVPTDPEDRVALVHNFFYDFIRERETEFRHFLRRQLLNGLAGADAHRTVRPGYRVGLLETALEPIADELGHERLRRLINALGVLIGTEAVIAGQDSLHIDHDTARADNEWACRLLVRAARAEAAAEPAQPASRTRSRMAKKSTSTS